AGCRPSRPASACLAPRAPALVREPSPPGRRRPPLHSGHAPPRRQPADADLHALAVRGRAANVSTLSPAGMSMAKRAHVYPQIELEAADLGDGPAAMAPPDITVADALVLARKRNAGLLAAGAASLLREDLVRAASRGRGALRSAHLARYP